MIFISIAFVLYTIYLVVLRVKLTKQMKVFYKDRIEYLKALGKTYESLYRISCSIQDDLDNPNLKDALGDLIKETSSRAITLQLYSETGTVFKDV